MDTDRLLRLLPPELRTSLSEGFVVPVVGPRLTPTPGLHEFLESVVSELDGNACREVRVRFEQGDLSLALSKARESLGAEWGKILYDHYIADWTHWQQDEANKMLKPVWRLGSRLVLTSAVDTWLERCCPKRGPLSCVVPNTPAPWSEHDYCVWHLNGDAADPASTVFEPLAVEALTQPDSSYVSSTRVLGSLLHARSLLFFGFSEGEFPRAQLNWLGERGRLANQTHYVLANESEFSLELDSFQSINLAKLGDLDAVLSALATLVPSRVSR